jgi:acyl-coenzyme A thioesterase PaaI-like protein
MAKTYMLKLGKRLAVVEVDLYSRGETELVAKAQVTYSIPPSPSA